MFLGYARVSALEPDARLQLDALESAGCDRVFVEHTSGATTARPQLDLLLKQCSDGDTLVVWRLDRIGKSMRHLLELVEDLEQMGVGLASLQEQVDMTTISQRPALHMFGALVAFERDLIRERTRAGLQAARTRGSTGGRPKALNPQSRELAQEMHASGTSVTEIAAALRVSRATIYRCLTPQREGLLE